MFIPTRESAEYLDDLAEELSVPESRYEQAERSYNSLGEWLHRDASTVRQYGPQVYVQGSFRLGTTIRPLTEREEYDIDSVCEFTSLAKTQVTQRALKAMLGREIMAYHNAHGMIEPVREGRRCWVLDYADDAQFHMDVVPALPNGQSVRLLLEARGYDPSWATTAIAITDNEVASYPLLTADWPRSNPKGYSRWFTGRMAVALERRKRSLAERLHASVEKIPDYRVRTPLQATVMILKRHRDVVFRECPEIRPISVILTTLAAHAYGGEESTAEALVAILEGMDRYVMRVEGRYLIPNPTDPLENFADKWEKHPERANAFFAWLGQARRDFLEAARTSDRALMTASVKRGVGELAERARRRRDPRPGSSLLKAASVAPATTGFSFPDKQRAPSRPQGFGGPR